MPSRIPTSGGRPSPPPPAGPLADVDVPGGAFIGVGCTAQWSGTVAVGADGEPLMPAIIWMDSRGNQAIRKVAGGAVNVLGYDPRKILRWVQVTGGAPGLSGKDPVSHILFIRDRFPDVYRRTATFLEPVDYLNLKLTGRTCASFDSIAAHWVTDNRVIDRVAYDDRLLEMTGLDRAKLPDLVAPGTIVGTLTTTAAADLGLPAGLPVVAGSGDVHSAVFGSGAVADFDAHLYIGTSSWISGHVPFKKTAPTTNVASIPAALAGKYVIVDEHETAGACLTFLRDNLHFADDFEAMNAMVDTVPPGSGRVLFTPWLNGERSPVDDHTIRGGFHNLSLSTTRAQMVRAVYEGVAFNSRWLLEAVEKFADRRLDSLAFIGGGANSDQWAQIHADVLDREIRQVADPVLANVRGAGSHHPGRVWAGCRWQTSRPWSRCAGPSLPTGPPPASTTSCSASSSTSTSRPRASSSGSTASEPTTVGPGPRVRSRRRQSAGPGLLTLRRSAKSCHPSPVDLVASTVGSR